MNKFENEYPTEKSDFEDGDYESEKDDDEESFTKLRIDPSDSDGSNSDLENEYPRKKSELELLREKNIKERDAFIAMLMNDPEYADVVASANEFRKATARKVTKPKGDPSFKFSGHLNVPLEKRRSSRLQNIPPVFFKEDLIDDDKITKKRKRSTDYDYYDLEEVIYKPRKSRGSSQNTVRTPVIPVEAITDAMIANIARKGTPKIYSDVGTSCHQCRQKTKDQKTYCRSTTCVGVRGQFCGVCLENRYGEDVAVALKDPLWKCPVCRNICNCSFCRQKAGKRPTGILAPRAQQTGHKSVKDFLDSLKGEGDYAHQDSLYKKLKDPNYLLGYSADLKYAHMGGNVVHKIDYYLSQEKMKKYICKKRKELGATMDRHDEPQNLLGFFTGTNKALLEDGTECYLGPVYWKRQVTQKIPLNGKRCADEVQMSEIKCLEESEENVQEEENDIKSNIQNIQIKVDIDEQNIEAVEITETKPLVDGAMEELDWLKEESKQLIQEEIKLESSPTSDYDEPSCLLGFYENKASMDDGTSCSLNCVHFKHEVLDNEDIKDN